MVLIQLSLVQQVFMLTIITQLYQIGTIVILFHYIFENIKSIKCFIIFVVGT